MLSEMKPESVPAPSLNRDNVQDKAEEKKVPRMFLKAASPLSETSVAAHGDQPSKKKTSIWEKSKLANIPTPSRSREASSAIANLPTPSRSRKAAPPTGKETSQLPPVVSVRKMTSKGCAIVILRDQAVMELSVAMKVAVVDGICIEVRRHTSSSLAEGEEQPLGVFCAWGFRIERRMSVSEEGLAEYFNGLSSVARPKGLDPKPPVTETLQYFELSSKGPLPMDADIKSDCADASQLLNGPHGRPDLVNSLWHEKQRLANLWAKPPPPMGRSLMQRVAREQLFPHSGKEGKEHENRAGEKLEELALAVGLLEGVPKNSAFLDLCGGPGSWSQFLLEKHELALRGFGLTLRSNSGEKEDWNSQEKDDWYPDLMENPNWTALWGEDGTGDLLKPKNLQHSAQELRDAGGIFLCVADGGFNDKAIPPNLLELYFYRLFLAELLTAVSCLQPGGRFVCKMYTSFSAATSSLLFLTTRLFDKVAITKPMTSRIAGPERYLYASGFRQGPETEEIQEALSQSQAFGAGASPLQTPLLTPIVPASEFTKDSCFFEQLRCMVSTLCERQSSAVGAIVDRAEYLEEIALDAAEEASEKAKYWEAAAAVQREIELAERAAQRAARDAQRDSENIKPTSWENSKESTLPPSKGTTWQSSRVRALKGLTGSGMTETSLRPQRRDDKQVQKPDLNRW